MNTLPQSFYIKNPKNESPLWKAFIRWFSVENGQRPTYYTGNLDHYGKDREGNLTNNWTSSDLSSAQEITLEQWNEAVNGKKGPKAGDLIEIKDLSSGNWCKRRFLRMVDGKAIVIWGMQKEPGKDEITFSEYQTPLEWRFIDEKPQLPVIHGYAGQLIGNIVKYGCAEMFFEDVRALAKTPKGISLSYGGNSISRENIEQVLKVIDHK